jgi:predicted nuclease of predicted toxin-antitoxin system
VTGDAPPSLLFDECVDRVLTVPAFAPHRAITFSRDLAPRAIDPDVLALARDLGMILVTEDVGFGRLVFQRRMNPPVGVILIALDPMPRSQRAAYLETRAADA